VIVIAWVPWSEADTTSVAASSSGAGDQPPGDCVDDGAAVSLQELGVVEMGKMVEL
jgi:hypothetical protein